MARVPGEVNIADHLTKAKYWWDFEHLLKSVGGTMVQEGKTRSS